MGLVVFYRFKPRYTDKTRDQVIRLGVGTKLCNRARIGCMYHAKSRRALYMEAVTLTGQTGKQTNQTLSYYYYNVIYLMIMIIIIIVTYLLTFMYVSLCMVCNTTSRLSFAEENVYFLSLFLFLSVPFRLIFKQQAYSPHFLPAKLSIIISDNN